MSSYLPFDNSSGEVRFAKQLFRGVFVVYLAKLRAVRFGYWFLTLQVLISAPWLTWDLLHSGLTPSRYAGAMATLAVLTTVFTAGLTWSRRRAVAELKDVEAFRRVLDVT